SCLFALLRFILGQRKSEIGMSLSLGFPEFSEQLALTGRSSLEVAVSRFPSAYVRHLPAAEGAYADVPAPVDERLRMALARRGIERLYCHQGEAFEHIYAGRNVAIVTPTASGKTLCYNLPVLNLLLNELGARAMYLFPTKALAEDQLHELQG